MIWVAVLYLCGFCTYVGLLRSGLGLLGLLCTYVGFGFPAN